MDSLSREELAQLGREYLLAGHLIDRAGMPLVLGERGAEAMEAVAIDEWSAASPLYTSRMQRLLGFAGDDVATIFKGMQLDIGAPPEFMDFRYQVHDPRHGEFWLEHCGALMDVEPMGGDLVVAMCHHIEDPTFDATAQATNPRAQVRPVHRPPRQPADRHPHCHWTVEISDEDETAPAPPQGGSGSMLAGTQAAQLPLPRLAAGEDGRDDWREEGRDDYSGDLDPELQLESFSRSALLAVLDEVCLQGHLLSLAFSQSAQERFGPEAASSFCLRQFTGIAGLAARRLASTVLAGSAACEGRDALQRVADVLELHPAFRPRSYVDLRVTAEANGEGSEAAAGGGPGLRVEIGRCPAIEEEQPSWIGLLAAGHTEPIEAIVHAIEPRARVELVEAGPVAAWRVRFDPAASPVKPADEVELAAFSTGADFSFVGAPRRRHEPSRGVGA